MRVFESICEIVFDEESVRPLDLEARLDALAGPMHTGWRTSLIDFFRLLGIDPSYALRRELAGEFGFARYQGRRSENILLLKAVMRELAQRGAKVPVGLLD